MGCAVALDDRALGIADDFSAAAEECFVVDILVARRGAPSSCVADRVITGADLDRLGVHVIAGEWATPILEVAMPDTGRPWR
jgi:hypothetical protein